MISRAGMNDVALSAPSASKNGRGIAPAVPLRVTGRDLRPATTQREPTQMRLSRSCSPPFRRIGPDRPKVSIATMGNGHYTGGGVAHTNICSLSDAIFRGDRQSVSIMRVQFKGGESEGLLNGLTQCGPRGNRHWSDKHPRDQGEASAGYPLFVIAPVK